jgi:hypothetical protein
MGTEGKRGRHCSGRLADWRTGLSDAERAKSAWEAKEKEAAGRGSKAEEADRAWKAMEDTARKSQDACKLKEAEAGAALAGLTARRSRAEEAEHAWQAKQEKAEQAEQAWKLMQGKASATIQDWAGRSSGPEHAEEAWRAKESESQAAFEAWRQLNAQLEAAKQSLADKETAALISRKRYDNEAAILSSLRQELAQTLQEMISYPKITDSVCHAPQLKIH